jgi:hypothetical protein
MPPSTPKSIHSHNNPEPYVLLSEFGLGFGLGFGLINLISLTIESSYK